MIIAERISVRQRNGYYLTPMLYMATAVVNIVNSVVLLCEKQTIAYGDSQFFLVVNVAVSMVVNTVNNSSTASW